MKLQKVFLAVKLDVDINLPSGYYLTCKYYSGLENNYLAAMARICIYKRELIFYLANKPVLKMSQKQKIL